MTAFNEELPYRIILTGGKYYPQVLSAITVRWANFTTELSDDDDEEVEYYIVCDTESEARDYLKARAERRLHFYQTCLHHRDDRDAHIRLAQTFVDKIHTAKIHHADIIGKR